MDGFWARSGPISASETVIMQRKPLMIMKKQRPAADHPGFAKGLIFGIPCLFVFFCVLLKITADDFYRTMIQEDGLVESLQAVFFLCASVFASAAAVRFSGKKRFIHSVLFYLLSLGLFFIAMEEISWGQRILRFNLPGFFQKHNVQGELTIHNLEAIQYHFLIPIYILVGFYGSFAWLVLRRFDSARREALGWFVPEWFLVPCFLPLFVIYSYFMIGVYAYWHRIDAFSIGGFVLWRDQEPAEFLMALGFLLFTLFVRRRQMVGEKK